MKKLAFSVAVLNASAAIAGGGMGGGTPPAREALEKILMENQNMNGGQFDLGRGKVGLGLKASLEPELTLSRSSFQTQGLRLSDVDFDSLKLNQAVDAVSFQNPAEGDMELSRSYRIEDGNYTGELVLKDRRQIMRESVQ